MANTALQIPTAQAPVLQPKGIFTTVWYLFLQALSENIPQIGDCIVQASGQVTDDYLPCNGSAVSRTLYSSLFSVIGIAYGPGDGMTTFNLPGFGSLGGPSFWKIRYK